MLKKLITKIVLNQKYKGFEKICEHTINCLNYIR